VRLDVGGGEPGRRGGLVDRRGVQVGGLLGDGQRRQQPGRRPQPPQPQPRRGDLGEAAQVHDVPVGAGLRGQWEHRRPAVAQLAVGVVLHHPHAVPRRQLDDLGPPALRHRAAGRVGEGGDQVEQGRSLPPDDLRERLRVEAVLVGADRDDAGPGQLEALQCGEVRRVLDEHDRARVEQRGGDQAERLLRTRGDQQVVHAGGQAARGHPRGDPRTQRAVALGGRVLEGTPCVGTPEHLVEGGAHAVQVEQLGSGQATGEGDDLRTVEQGEQLAHRRAGHAVEAGGEGRSRTGEDGRGHRGSRAECTEGEDCAGVRVVCRCRPRRSGRLV
jgi:hypothetical protein